MNLQQIYVVAKYCKNFDYFKSEINKIFNNTPITVVDDSEYKLSKIQPVEQREVKCSYKTCNEKTFMYGFCKHHLVQQDL